MGPETHTFWDLYTCPQWLTTFGCESASVTDEVNIEETNTVWTQSLPKGRGMHCHGRTSRWATPITSVQVGEQGHQQSKRILYIIYSTLYFTVARSAEGRLPGRPAALSWGLRVSVPGAFLRPAGGSCRVENLNSSVYVYLANLQSEKCETPVSCDNLLRDFLGLRSNVCLISSSFSSVSTWVLWGFLSRTEPVSRNLFTSLRTVSLWGARISGNLSLNSSVTSLQDSVRT